MGIANQKTYPSGRISQSEPLGKALLRGTWKDMASAAFKIKELKAELLKFALKEIQIEACLLVSSKHPSVLRSVDVKNMAELSLENICQELRKRAPLIFSVMWSIALSKHSVKQQMEWLPSVAAAASILLKERSRFMNGFQLILTIIIKHTGYQVCYYSIYSSKSIKL